MRAYCQICGEEMELSIDQFLEVDQDIDDFFCDDCSCAALEYCAEYKLREN
jgi:hypothetical protein